MFSPNKEKTYATDYLTFLGLSLEKPSLDYLNKLMETHLHKVPFDGSNFVTGKVDKMSLKTNKILQQFIEGKGGVCYQQNGAFKRLLCNLGFDASLVTVTMHYFNAEKFPYAEQGHDVHCAILVTLNYKTYLVDLVWGNAFRHPLPCGEEVSDPTGNYRFQTITLEDGKPAYQLESKVKGEWYLQYQFTHDNKKISYFFGDLKYICSEEHHLSKRFLLMQSKENFSCDIVVGEKSKSITLIKQTPFHTEKEQLDDPKRAMEVLQQFHVDEENIDFVLANYKFN